ncbi:hypothetical protein [Absidia glauca]|uniref:Response regulatory domain-containing protein n=1 Tax=Absidia glauca TaxID=4829 RepID=A0A168SG70_ABSGL|nr:hypothetical protein [Absidia glauca]
MMLNTYSHFTNKSKQTLPSSTHTKLPTSSLSLTLLLVDDNPINLQLLRKTLLAIFKVRHMDLATNGYQALRLLEQRHYDAILLDIDMPGMNGIETTEIIRQRPSSSSPIPSVLDLNRSIPILAVTTNDSSESRRIYENVGMVRRLPQ